MLVCRYFSDASSPFNSEYMCYNVFKPNQLRIPMPKTRYFSDHEKPQALEPLHQRILRRRQIATLSEKSISLSDKRTMSDKVLTNQQRYNTLTLTLALHLSADESPRRPQKPPQCQYRRKWRIPRHGIRDMSCILEIHRSRFSSPIAGFQLMRYKRCGGIARAKVDS